MARTIANPPDIRAALAKSRRGSDADALIKEKIPTAQCR